MKVLIADDDPVSRILLQSFLEKWGYEVVAARDGEEAWNLFQAGDFPLVISDWMMPVMDGIDLVRKIRSSERPRYVYTILVTAKSRKEDLVLGMDAGADDFLTKPFDRGELRVRLREGERIINLESKLADQNRALQEAQAALVQSEKMASLGQLSAGMAHEINNPVAFVTNNLSVLKRDVQAAFGLLERYRQNLALVERCDAELAGELKQQEEEIDLAFVLEHAGPLFEKSLAGLERVRAIIGNLRDFSRLDEADFKDADINAALETTLGMLRPEIEAQGIQLETHYAALPTVLCHPGKLNQVFFHLIRNAVQACEPGGRVEVSTSRGDDETLVVEICDHGAGISSEHQRRLFEPFFTTRPVGQGRGLGLSVSYGIIRDHGGRIDVESTPGRGSTFRVNIPLQPPRKA